MITYDEWVGLYSPTVNLNIAEDERESAPYNGTMFETFGEDLAQVQAANPLCVWTLLYRDGEMWISSGVRLRNRIGYFITDAQCVGVVDFEISQEVE
jgi:hypothetical protein